MLVNQPTKKPTRKVTAGSLGGILGLLLIWFARNQFDIPLGPEEAGAVVTLAFFLFSYFTRDRANR